MKSKALIGLFIGIGAVSFFQSRLLWKVSDQEVSSSNILAQAMQARLSGISRGISAYLQNHDADSLERIKTEGREAGKLLAEFKVKAVQDGSGEDFARIERSHEQLREATVDLLAADNAAVKAWNDLNESSKALISLLSDRIEASIKPNQLNASTRLKAVRSAIEQANNVAKFPAPGQDLDTSRARFRRSMAAYEELSRTRQAERWAEEARSLLDQCVKQTRDLMRAEEKKQSSTAQYTARLDSLTQMVQADHSVFASLSGVHSIKRLFGSGLIFMVLIGALLLVGVGLVVASDRKKETQQRGPLQEILQCVEAAATGDVSRIPDHWSQDEVGRLSQAVGRLITVLARSENLVYHLAALVDGSGEAIISHTLDGTILSWNKGAQRIYGYSVEEVKGRSISILSPEDGGAEMMNILQRICQGERPQPFETLHQARNGRTVRAFVRVSAILDSTRKVIGASFCAQELADQGLLQPKALEGSQLA